MFTNRPKNNRLNLNWNNKKVLITEVVHPVVETQLSELGFECTHLEKTTYEEVLAQINQYAGLIVRSKIKVDKTMIDQGQALRFIGRTGSGMEHIDQAHAESKGIAVFRSPEGNKDSVAEQAVGLLLCLLNNIVKSDAELRQRYWNRLANRGEELMGKTVGIIGFGNTGSAFAQRLQGFQVRILAHDKYKKGFGNEQVEEANLAQIFAQADVLSVHLPLNKETAHYINGAFLAQFQKPIFLINTSRGGVLNTVETLDALDKKQLRGLGIDVFENEKLSSFTPAQWQWMERLVAKQNVVLTPHTAGVTHQSFYKLGKIVVDRIEAWVLKTQRG